MIPGKPEDAVAPLVFAILSALTPPDIVRVFYDQRIEPIPFDEPTDLVAISVETFTAKSAYQIAARYRRRGIPVIMGGHHPTLNPKEALKFATSIVIGDAEGVWPDLIDDARRGTLQSTYGNRNCPLGGLRPDRTVFKGKRYNPVTLVEFGRGCRFTCDFCAYHAFYGNSIRYRPVNEVVEEIRQLGRKYIWFTDDNFFADIAEAKKLLRALKPLRIHFSCETTLDIASDPELVRLLAESGCMLVAIGFESFNLDNLKQMGKEWNRAYGSYEEVVRTFHNYGIMVWGMFVFGYDYDTVASFQSTLEFARRQKLLTANFNPLVPWPGTPLYERLNLQGRLTYGSWWIHPEFRYGQACFHPKGMTAQQLKDGCYGARTQFNKWNSILMRGLNWRANFHNLSNAGVYMAVNWITKHENQRKQGQLLGFASK